MPEEREERELLTEICSMVNQLIAVFESSREALTYQRPQPLDHVNTQRGAILLVISPAIQRINGLMVDKSGQKRDSYIRLHSILTHLKIIVETTGHIEEILRKQIKEGILFSDKAISQLNLLFHKQSEILYCLSDFILNNDEGIRHQATEECKSTGQSCIQFATDHENRLVEGLCYPQAAPFFLGFIDQMQTIIHHESELARLLATNSDGNPHK